MKREVMKAGMLALAVAAAAPAASQTVSLGGSLSWNEDVDGTMGGLYADMDVPIWKALHIVGGISMARAKQQIYGWIFGSPLRLERQLTRFYTGAGIRVRGGSDRVHGFAHVLFGAVSVIASGDRESVYGEQYGGGVDVFISDSWGLRAAIDYNKSTHFNIGASWRR